VQSRHRKKDGTLIDVEISSYEFVSAGRRTRLVIAVDVTIPAGHAVEPLPEGDRYLGFVLARGGDAGEVEATLRRAWALLGVVIDTTNEVAALSG